MRVVWSKRATSRIIEIGRYIAQDSPQNAQRWVEEVFGAVEGLADFPEMGKPGRDVTTPGVSELVFGNYRVFYEIGTAVDILTVRRCSELIDEDELIRRD